MNPSLVGGKAARRRAVQLGESDHRSRIQVLRSRVKDDRAVNALASACAGPDLDPARGEQLRDGVTGDVAEHAERLRLRRHDRDRDLDRQLAGAALRHQCELVDRQRPASGGWHDECDPPGLMLGRLAQQCVDVDRLPRGLEGRGVSEGGARLRPYADDRDVEIEHRAVVEVGGMTIRVDVPQSLLNERAVRFRNEVREIEPDRRLRRERRLHGHRLVDELRRRRDEGHLDAIARQVPECQERLDSGDAAARDQDLHSLVGHRCLLSRSRVRLDPEQPAQHEHHRRPHRAAGEGTAGTVTERARCDFDDDKREHRPGRERERDRQQRRDLLDE